MRVRNKREDKETVELYQEGLHDFLSDILQKIPYTSIEYIGVNLPVYGGERCEYKVYLKEISRLDYRDSVIENLQKRGMIRHINLVQDTTGADFRCDIGLGRRNNDNMSDLVQWIKAENIPYGDEVDYLSHMSISDDVDYQQASWYFWGFTVKGEKIVRSKYHFITRKCRDTDMLSKNIILNDQYYLDYIAGSGIKEFEFLTEVIRKVLIPEKEYLWMAGLDISEQHNKKYKIYIKNISDDTILRLFDVLKEYSGVYCKANMAGVILVGKSELKAEGLALCIDSQGKISINLYFRLCREKNMRLSV